MDVLTLSMAKAYSDSKGGYTKSRIEQILPEATHNFELQDGFAMVMIERNAVLYEGQSCTVLWDGKTYNCNVFVVEESTVIGNAGIFTGESGGEEPFFISFEEGVIVLVAEIAGEHTVSVSSTTETIVPIDQKYLPGVCLPVVELSTTFSMGAALTDAENELLTGAHAKNVPLVIRCSMNLGNSSVFENTAAVWSPASSGGIKAFVLSMGGIVLQIADMLKDGNWICATM